MKSQESDTTPVVANKSPPSQNRSLPPSRRVDSGDDEVSTMPIDRPSSQIKQRRPLIAQEEGPRGGLLPRGESARSFMSSSSYRSNNSCFCAAPQLGREESNKSFSSELDYYCLVCSGNSSIGSRTKMSTRSMTPPDLIRNVTQSSARGNKSHRRENCSPVWRPHNPVASQLRQDGSNTDHSSFFSAHQQHAMNAPYVSRMGDSQLTFPTAGGSSPSQEEIQWNPTGNSFMDFHQRTEI